MFKIMIIDDTKSVHAFVRCLLEKSKEITISDAMNGSEAATRLLGGEKVDLILLDWEMPVLNGPETLKKLKSSGLTTPIIMMTTKNAPEDIQKMLGEGAAEYLMKPFTIDILFEKIEFVSGRAFAYAA